MRESGTNERHAGNPEHDEVLDRVLRQRERHRQRSMFVRVGFVISGSVVGILGAILMVIAPELGIPLLLLGLRLLAYEFDWAARVYAYMARLLKRLREWYRRLSPWKRVGLITTAVLIVVALVVWLV